MASDNHQNHVKEMIRQRYRGGPSEGLVVIPAIEEASFYEDNSEKRVGIYARVSTDDIRQTSSFELQKSHYEDMVKRYPNWHLVDIYADEGISGTSLNKRDAFNRMMLDCEAGKLDLIVTKSVSRFARNVYDCIGCVRKLSGLANPIGVFFENEHLYTLDQNSEMSLSFIATLAQEESHIKSNSMNLSYDMRFRREIFLTPELLGYDLDEEGLLVINEEEALTVRLIFFMYLYGYSCQQIAETLMRLKRLTKRGNRTWSAGTVLSILQNERHCGDVLARKTWTPNYLDHKSKKNFGKRNQYYKSGHHEAIVSKDDYIAVQQLIANAKYGYKGVLPTLRVIEDGALQGFVTVNMRWGGFSKEDYLDAATSVMDVPAKSDVEGNDVNPPLKAEPAVGDFDLRGFELVRAQFLGTYNEPGVTVSINEMHFFSACFSKFESTLYVEMLLNPIERLLVVRPSKKDTKNAVQWFKIPADKYLPRELHGAGFLKVLYELLDWDSACIYRIQGVKQQNETGAILMFDLKDAECIMPLARISDQMTSSDEESHTNTLKPLSSHSKASVVAYPASWAEGFGSEYYEGKSVNPGRDIGLDAAFDINQPGSLYSGSGETPQPTGGDELATQISGLMNVMESKGGADE